MVTHKFASGVGPALAGSVSLLLGFPLPRTPGKAVSQTLTNPAILRWRAPGAKRTRPCAAIVGVFRAENSLGFFGQREDRRLDPAGLTLVDPVPCLLAARARDGAVVPSPGLRRAAGAAAGGSGRARTPCAARTRAFPECREPRRANS